LTQSFLADLLDKRRLALADPTRGRFRTFMTAALDNFLKNQWRSQQTQKRGGQQCILPLDFGKAEEQYRCEPVHEWTPEKIFERNWALAVLKQALAAVERQYQENGKNELFAALVPHVCGSADLSYREIAERLGMKEGAIRVAVYRLRERYSQQLRLQIAKTVDSPAEVEDELRSLFGALSN
jgi:RNA polymerase sigma-70 factor (ECF subfamily)